MGRIFQFPTQPRMRARQTYAPRKADASKPRSALSENLIIQILAGVIVFVAICTWPILRWLLCADLIVQVLRMAFLSGWASFAAFLHILFLGVLVYVILLVVPASPK
ncbi:hypothetical protein GEV01_19385 [Rugamonas sp. FT103W]|uniref:Protein kleE n=1 Tax=Rugamonas rivuli TaxID=2743358 RepID=A0A843SI62_9BURK|nr:KleE stable inheritance protein [Rugamonas rivuli]MQA21684.1 hypothetical protein [Rugamonas rivuli]